MCRVKIEFDYFVDDDMTDKEKAIEYIEQMLEYGSESQCSSIRVIKLEVELDELN